MRIVDWNMKKLPGNPKMSFVLLKVARRGLVKINKSLRSINKSSSLKKDKDSLEFCNHLSRTETRSLHFALGDEVI